MGQSLLVFIVIFVKFSADIVTIRLNGKGEPGNEITNCAIKPLAIDRCLETSPLEVVIETQTHYEVDVWLEINYLNYLTTLD